MIENANMVVFSQIIQQFKVYSDSSGACLYEPTICMRNFIVDNPELLDNCAGTLQTVNTATYLVPNSPSLSTHGQPQTDVDMYAFCYVMSGYEEMPVCSLINKI